MNRERTDAKTGAVDLRTFLLKAKLRRDQRASDLAAREKTVDNESERGRARFERALLKLRTRELNESICAYNATALPSQLIRKCHNGS